MHLPTIILFAMLSNGIVGIYLYLLYRRKPKYNCFKLWALSCVSFMIGGSLAATRYYELPSFVSYFVADAFLLLAPIFILAGLIQFSRFRFTKNKRRQSLIIFVFALLALFLSHQHPALINIIAAILVGTLFLLCALLLRKSVFNEPVFTRVLTAIFVLHGFVLFSQSGLFVFAYLSDSTLSSPPGTMVTLVSHIMLTTLTALLLPWLCFLKLERKLTLKSQRDGLTKLSNREYFFEQVERYWHQYKSLPCGLLMIDVDYFKRINDKFGHATGDLALKEISKLLSKQVRNNDAVGRIGGEEFAILLVDAKEPEVIKIAQRIREQVANHLSIVDNKHLNLTVSIGVVPILPSDCHYSAVLKQADTALYTSKSVGRNTVTPANMSTEN